MFLGGKGLHFFLFFRVFGFVSVFIGFLKKSPKFCVFFHFSEFFCKRRVFYHFSEISVSFAVWFFWKTAKMKSVQGVDTPFFTRQTSLNRRKTPQFPGPPPNFGAPPSGTISKNAIFTSQNHRDFFGLFWLVETVFFHFFTFFKNSRGRRAGFDFALFETRVRGG